jgi:putative transposase
VKRAYKFRLYPTEEQASVLGRTMGCARKVWNWALAERTRAWRMDGETLGYHAMSARLTELKKDPDYAYLREVSSVPLQQALRHQQTAFGNFFAHRARYPRFKSRRGRQSIEYTTSAFRWRDGRLWLAKMATPLDIRMSRAVPAGAPSTVTVSRDTAGRWFVSMLFEDTVADLPITGAVVGLDLGLKHFLTTSDGDKVEHPRLLRDKEARLKRYQRRMSRCQKGSRNREKARRKVARQHARVADARRDFLHKESTRIVRTYDVIVVEDLSVSNMVRNHSLAKSISDSGWGEFRSQLAYKADWYGKRLVVIDRFTPTSKTCSECGHLLASLSLGTRHWTCPGCGTLHDRDINAAKNILAAGLAVEACGAGVRHSGSPPMRPAVNQEPKPSVGGV